jgi:hypothetical protein
MLLIDVLLGIPVIILMAALVVAEAVASLLFTVIIAMVISKDERRLPLLTWGVFVANAMLQMQH